MELKVLKNPSCNGKIINEIGLKALQFLKEIILCNRLLITRTNYFTKI